MTMQRISPRLILIYRRLIGLVQQRVQHPLAREDSHQRAQHRQLFLRHYTIETKQIELYCFVVHNVFSFFLSRSFFQVN